MPTMLLLLLLLLPSLLRICHRRCCMSNAS